MRIFIVFNNSRRFCNTKKSWKPSAANSKPFDISGINIHLSAKKPTTGHAGQKDNNGKNDRK
jgi:hypothetical protein